MSDALDNTTWILAAPIEMPDDIDVTIALADGMVSGYAGCNRLDRKSTRLNSSH